MWAWIQTTIHVERNWFFRIRLLSLDPDGVRDLIEKYKKYTQGIKEQAMSYSWYMRGGASYEDILNMSIKEREGVKKLIEKNLETTKDSQLPFF